MPCIAAGSFAVCERRAVRLVDLVDLRVRRVGEEAPQLGVRVTGELGRAGRRCRAMRRREARDVERVESTFAVVGTSLPPAMNSWSTSPPAVVVEKPMPNS